MAAGSFGKLSITTHAKTLLPLDVLNGLKDAVIANKAANITMSRLPMSNLPSHVLSDTQARCQAIIKNARDLAIKNGFPSISCAASELFETIRCRHNSSPTCNDDVTSTVLDAQPSDEFQTNEASIAQPCQSSFTPTLSEHEVKKRIGSSKRRRSENIKTILFALIGKFAPALFCRTLPFSNVVPYQHSS